MSKKSIKELIHNILESEKKNNIFSLEFNKFPIWPYFRMYFFYKYMKDINLYQTPVSKIEISFIYILNMLKIFNIFKLFKKKDYFILEHSRSNKNGIDIYTDNLVNELNKDNCSFFCFSQLGIVNKKNDVIVLDFIKIISKINSKIFYNFVNNSFYENNFNDFLKDLDVQNKKKYIKLFKRYHFELILQYYFYFLLLKLKKTKKVFLTVSYLNLPLVFAAKNLSIEVIEIQHGVISKYHLGYHFPYYSGDFFPDKLFTFGRYWNESAIFPKESKIVAIGNDFMHINNMQEIEKIPNTILIISQGTIGKKLEEYILNNINSLNKYKIYFKLHPSEFNDKNRNYKRLLDIKNVECITNEFTIQELQLRCEYQIGVYSTAIFEGLEKKCKTILLNEMGVEYMEDLIEKQMVYLINYEDKLKEVLIRVKQPEEILFFEKYKGLNNAF